MRTGPGAPSSARTASKDSLSKIAELVAERERIEQARKALTAEIRSAMRTAHDDGNSWETIATTAGYQSANAAKNHAAPKGSTSRSSQAGTFTVAEAAELLGISRQTVYDRIKSGDLKTTDDRARGRRVRLPKGIDRL